MLKEINEYDWAEVFGEGSGGNCTPISPNKFPSDPVSIETFSREDVVEILGQEEGESGGPDWIIWGKLKDGRYFFARGGCDYTGWDCQANNGGDVASSEEILIRFGMSKDERARFNKTLPEDRT